MVTVIKLILPLILATLANTAVSAITADSHDRLQDDPLLLVPSNDLEGTQLKLQERLAQPDPSQLAPHGKIAIVIDDLGNSLRAGLEAIALPANITFAVMPHRKHSKMLAERAKRLGREVILHAPMSTQNGRDIGAGALTQSMDETFFKNRLRFAIDSIPHLTGVNNHMGSFLTTQPQAMEWVMEVVKEKGLFFVDSRTHANSVAYSTAKRMGLSTASRDVFLDHEINIDAIHKQFKRTVAIARKYGSAIAIGHPHKATLTYLQHVLPQLEHSDIHILSVSELLESGIQDRPDSARESRPADLPNLDHLIHQLQLSKNLPASL